MSTDSAVVLVLVGAAIAITSYVIGFGCAVVLIMREN